MKSFYFPHDYVARHDSKILRLRCDFGLEGYGVYFCLLEMICEADGSLDVSHIPSIAMSLNIDSKTLASILKLCCDIGLFVLQDGCISSTRLDAHLATVEAKRAGGRASAEKRKAANSNDSASMLQVSCNTPEGDLEKVKESKVNESKVNQIKKRENGSALAPPPLHEVVQYFEKIDGSTNEAWVMYDHYTANGWKQGRGKPIKDWRAAARNWMRRAEDFKQRNTHNNINTIFG